jgi:hypothetical protein
MISLMLSVIISTELLTFSSIFGRSADSTVINRQPIKATSFTVAKKQKYSLSNFSVRGVNAEMTDGMVIEKLGKPHKTEELWSCAKTYTLTYDRTIFHIGSIYWSISQGTPSCAYEVNECVPLTTLDERISSSKNPVWAVSTSNPRYRTDRGIKVGDSISKTKKIYDRILSPSLDQKFGVLEYTEKGDGNLLTNLRFKYQNEKITHIEYEKYYKEDCDP